jgi:NitT/TauT family transport system substrate-binding protein
VTGISRRALLGGLAASFAAAACGRVGGVPGVVRLGYLANLSHAPVIAGIASGRLEAALGGAVRIEPRVFRAGPRVVEALLGRAIDVGVSGPAPIVVAHARHGPGTLCVVSGCASGGASFVVTRRSGISRPEDLHGRQLATVQLGSTQDVALRTYLREAGLDAVEHGGDVQILALAAPAILLQMRRGELAGAWLTEPSATRAVEELDGVRLVDERDRWPRHAFPSALLVTRSDFADARRSTITELTRAVRAEVLRANDSPAVAEEESFEAIGRLVGNAGARSVFHSALERVDFTIDPLPAAVDTFAADACALGFIPRVACASLFDTQV